MAIVRSATQREENRLWAIASKEKAQRLLARTDGISQTVLSSIDNLISFLDLMARIHQFDAYNLLLIWDRCPDASCLAGYKTWERQLPEGTQILKEAHKGKAIELIAPFTVGSGANSYLIWFSQNVFDVSQTNVPAAPPPIDCAYILDENHEAFLLDALQMAIATKFGRSILIQPPSQKQLEYDLPGEIKENAVIVREDLSVQDHLQWFTEVLAQLSIQGADLPPVSSKLLRDCIRYCLFRIWRLEALALPPRSTEQLNSVSQNQLMFLHLLRDTVRGLNTLVRSCYMEKRNEDEELSPSELEKLKDDSQEP